MILVVYVIGFSEVCIVVEVLKSGVLDYVIKNVSEDFFLFLVDVVVNIVVNVRLCKVKEEVDEEMRWVKEWVEVLFVEMNYCVVNSFVFVISFLCL